MSSGTSQHDHSPDDGSRPEGPPAGDCPGVSEAVQAYGLMNALVRTDQPLDPILAQVTELAQQIIPEAEVISITVLDHGRPRSIAFTGPLAVTLDELQYEDGSGPCLDAARTGRTIEIPDTADDTDYPDFGRRAQQRGVRHVLSVGIPSRHDLGSGMNIYGRATPGRFAPETRDIAQAFASYASIAVLNATLTDVRLEEADRIRTAAAARGEIEQAKGIIMRDQRCTANQAFDRLRVESGRARRPLRDVARRVVENERNGAPRRS